MARKAHTKSRSGCLECKKRRIKCDETRPICHKCTFSKRVCAYDNAIPGPGTAKNNGHTTSPASSSTHRRHGRRGTPPRSGTSTHATPARATPTRATVAKANGQPTSSPYPIPNDQTPNWYSANNSGQAGHGFDFDTTWMTSTASMPSVLATSLASATTTSPALAPSPVNLDHLELLYNFEHWTSKTIAFDSAHSEVYRRTILTRSFENAWLMHGVLAFSALQISLHPSHLLAPSRIISEHTYHPHGKSTASSGGCGGREGAPECKRKYTEMANALQSSALSRFRSAMDRIDASNCLDVLLFSHIVAPHVLCDAFNKLRDTGDFTVFLEGLVRCIRLLRDVNHVIQIWWDVLAKTELGVLMRKSNAIVAKIGPYDAPTSPSATTTPSATAAVSKTCLRTTSNTGTPSNRSSAPTPFAESDSNPGAGKGRGGQKPHDNTSEGEHEGEFRFELGFGHECSKIRKSISLNSDLGSASVRTCMDAIDRLQTCLDAERLAGADLEHTDSSTNDDTITSGQNNPDTLMDDDEDENEGASSSSSDDMLSDSDQVSKTHPGPSRTKSKKFIDTPANTLAAADGRRSRSENSKRNSDTHVRSQSRTRTQARIWEGGGRNAHPAHVRAVWSTASSSTNMVFAWLTTASTEFTDLLDQRRPEALVLLGYYAVILHKRRLSWAIGDAGAKILQGVNGYLGRRWAEWLEWPNWIIRGDEGEIGERVAGPEG